MIKFLLFFLFLFGLLGCANNAEVQQNPPQRSTQDQDQQTAGQTNQQNYHIINNESDTNNHRTESDDVEIITTDGTATKVARSGGAVNVQVFNAPTTSGDTTPGNSGTQTPSTTNTGTASATQDITATLQLLLQLQAALQANQTPNQGQGAGTATNTTTNDQQLRDIQARLDALTKALENENSENTESTSDSGT